jgi:hypothetical protein
VIGFFRFTDDIAELKATGTQHRCGCDRVVLTGGYQRIDQALALLETVRRRLLISGVNPSTSSAALRRATGTKSATFDCCVDIGYEALDTIGNANETAEWIRQNTMPRSCCHQQLPHATQSDRACPRRVPRSVSWPIRSPMQISRPKHGSPIPWRCGRCFRIRQVLPRPAALLERSENRQWIARRC